MIGTVFRISLFLGGVLIAGHAAATEIRFETADPRAAGITIVRGLLAKPDGPGPFPAVVLLHTCGGLRPNLARVWPGFLVKQGYVALAVDSFGSRGLGPCPNGLSPPAPGARIFASRAMTSDAHGALAYLERRSFVGKGRTAVMGFSLGGLAIHFALLRSYARRKPPRAFKAAIAVYGPCAVRNGAVRMPKLARTPLPLLDIIGGNDKRILRECRDLLPPGPSARLRVIPGAYHGFDISTLTTMRRSSGGSPMLYSAEATRAARALVKTFLAKHLRR